MLHQDNENKHGQKQTLFKNKTRLHLKTFKASFKWVVQAHLYFPIQPPTKADRWHSLSNLPAAVKCLAYTVFHSKIS